MSCAAGASPARRRSEAPQNKSVPPPGVRETAVLHRVRASRKSLLARGPWCAVGASWVAVGRGAWEVKTLGPHISCNLIPHTSTRTHKIMIETKMSLYEYESSRRVFVGVVFLSFRGFI